MLGILNIFLLLQKKEIKILSDTIQDKNKEIEELKKLKDYR